MSALANTAVDASAPSNVTPFPLQTQRPSARPTPRAVSKDTFAHIPEHVIESGAFSSLNSFTAVRILLHAAAQYRRPEKPITLPVIELVQRGYGSKANISRAIERLEKAKLLVRIKNHGNGQCALFQLGWKQVDRR